MISFHIFFTIDYDTRSEACQRFFREGLTISFTKILTDEAVSGWKYEIHVSVQFRYTIFGIFETSQYKCLISSRGHQIVGPVGHLHLWSDSELKLKDQMSDRSLESFLHIFGHKILIIAPTGKYHLRVPMDLSNRADYGFQINSIIILYILSRN